MQPFSAAFLQAGGKEPSQEPVAGAERRGGCKGSAPLTVQPADCSPTATGSMPCSCLPPAGCLAQRSHGPRFEPDFLLLSDSMHQKQGSLLQPMLFARN